jgi:hypothetical protein
MKKVKYRDAANFCAKLQRNGVSGGGVGLIGAFMRLINFNFFSFLRYQRIVIIDDSTKVYLNYLISCNCFISS